MDKHLNAIFKTNNSPLTTFPNPAKSSVTIQGSHIASLQVVDHLGKVVKAVSLKDAKNPTLSVSELQCGDYHHGIQVADGKISTSGFIKK